MKRVSVILVSAILSILPGKAETGLIPVMPVVSDGLPLSPTALKALGNKVTAMAVESGFGALSSPIVLTADVNIADKTVTDTAPPMVVTEVEVFFYVADVDAQVILAETSVTVKSVDKTENKAVASAINKVNLRTPVMRQFMQRAREKVLEYYEKRTPVLLEKAVTLAERKEYDKALLVLSNIPEGVPQWKEADELAYSIYFSKIDLEAETLLHKAKIALAQNDYEKALEHISVISPQSRFFPDAQEMVSDIKAENDQVKALQAQVAALSTERDALKEDKAKAEQELHRFTASQRDAIDAENRSVEKKLTDWLLGSLGEKAVESTVNTVLKMI